MKLPLISSKRVLKILEKKGFSITRQKGSHISLHKKEGEKTLLVVVPQKREIKKGTLLSILRQAAIKRDEFFKLLEEV
jgi:predicted RNA binding protein YcfA (HicA-like mRNA interferase family)